MGTILLNLLLLNIVAVVCIDKLRIYEPLKRLIWRINMGALPYRDFRLKPFDCALCCGWWLGFFYMAIFVHPFNLWSIVLPLAFAYCNHIIGDIITIAQTLFNKIYERILCGNLPKKN